METPMVVGLDLAKSVFQIHAIQKGKVVMRRQLRRGAMLNFSPRSRGAWLAWRHVPRPIIGHAS
jgi:hypothetical protein